MNNNVGDSFKRWRNINNIEKLRERIDNTTKENVLKVLDGLLKHSKHDIIK
jgi:serine phosphatase RsbU (regulator of sigma subunit)